MEWKCKNCGTVREDFPYLVKKRKYCCISCQLKYEYKHGKRDPQKTIEKAHETIRTKGHYKRDNSFLSNNHMSKEARKKLSIDRRGSGNPMYGKRPWNKQEVTKKWWEEKEFVRLRKICLDRDNHKCVQCSVSDKEKHLYCDHIIPYRIIKNHMLLNLQMLCGSCHSKKTAVDVKGYSLRKKQPIQV